MFEIDLNFNITATVIIISLLLGGIAIPIVLGISSKKGLYDMPNERKVHTKAISRLGGTTFLPCIGLASLITLALYSIDNLGELILTRQMIIFLCGALLVYIVGIADDVIGVSAIRKLIIQIACASCLPLAGLYINNLYGFMGVHEIPSYAGILLTVFISVYIMNAINLIDGIDGLASSLCLLAFIVFGFKFLHLNILYTILAFSMAGIIVVFLKFNLFGDIKKGHKIFMGDTGSLTLGYIISFLVIKYVMDNEISMPYRSDGLLVSCSVLIIPVFDVARVSLYRLRNHKPIFAPDKNHIHHKFMKAGCTPHWTLTIIMVLALLFYAINISLKNINITYVILIDIVLWILLNLYLDYRIKNKK